MDQHVISAFLLRAFAGVVARTPEDVLEERWTAVS